MALITVDNSRGMKLVYMRKVKAKLKAGNLKSICCPHLSRYRGTHLILKLSTYRIYNRNISVWVGFKIQISGNYSDSKPNDVEIIYISRRFISFISSCKEAGKH